MEHRKSTLSTRMEPGKVFKSLTSVMPILTQIHHHNKQQLFMYIQDRNIRECLGVQDPTYTRIRSNHPKNGGLDIQHRSKEKAKIRLTYVEFFVWVIYQPWLPLLEIPGPRQSPLPGQFVCLSFYWHITVQNQWHRKLNLLQDYSRIVVRLPVSLTFRYSEHVII